MSACRFTVAAALCAVVIVAQSAPEVAAIELGSASPLVAVKAHGCTALDVLSAAAAVHCLQLKTHPSALAKLAVARIDLVRTRLTLDELAMLVGQLTGVPLRLADGALRADAPPADAAAELESHRQAALSHTDYALTARPDAARTPELGAARGRLAFEGGDYDEAFSSYQSAARKRSSASFDQEARLWAAEAALRSGRVADALAVVEEFESDASPLPPVPGSELVAARVRAAAGQTEAAGVRLRRAAREATFARDRALAALLLTEFHWLRKDGKAMLAALEQFHPEARRAFPDLAKKVPFAMGLALSISGEAGEAVVHFRLALREDTHPGRRARAARAVADELRRAGRIFEALLAARQAYAVAPDGRSRLLAAAVGAELEAKLGLFDRAIATATAAFADATGPSPETDRLLDVVAGAALASDRPAAARDALAALSRRPGLHGRVVRLEAELLRREGDFRGALTRLSSLTEAEITASGLDAQTFARLQGEIALQAGEPLLAAKAFAAEAPPETSK